MKGWRGTRRNERIFFILSRSPLLQSSICPSGHLFASASLSSSLPHQSISLFVLCPSMNHPSISSSLHYSSPSYLSFTSFCHHSISPSLYLYVLAFLHPSTSPSLDSSIPQSLHLSILHFFIILPIYCFIYASLRNSISRPSFSLFHLSIPYPFTIITPLHSTQSSLHTCNHPSIPLPLLCIPALYHLSISLSHHLFFPVFLLISTIPLYFSPIIPSVFPPSFNSHHASLHILRCIHIFQIFPDQSIPLQLPMSMILHCPPIPV